MNYSLDIDLYKTGFDYEQYNCLDIPLFAGSGFYEYDNYYLLAMLLTINQNWIKENISNIENRVIINQYYGEVLKYLGMELVPCETSTRCSSQAKL